MEQWRGAVFTGLLSLFSAVIAAKIARVLLLIELAVIRQIAKCNDKRPGEYELEEN